MAFLLVLIYLNTIIMQTTQPCQAIPVAHFHGKRAPITCQPVGATQHVSFRDCVGAYNLMAVQAYSLHYIVSFGRGPNVNVRTDGDPLTWEFGTASENPSPFLQYAYLSTRDVCDRAPGARKRSPTVFLAKRACCGIANRSPMCYGWPARVYLYR